MTLNDCTNLAKDIPMDLKNLLTERVNVLKIEVDKLAAQYNFAVGRLDECTALLNHLPIAALPCHED